MTTRIVLPQSIYRKRRDPRTLPDELRLRALEWAIYFAVDGTRSAAELGRGFEANSSERDEALARLTSLELIEEREVDAAEYVRALAASGEREEKSLREFLTGAVRRTIAPAETRKTAFRSHPPRAAEPASLEAPGTRTVASGPAERPETTEAPAAHPHEPTVPSVACTSVDPTRPSIRTIPADAHPRPVPTLRAVQPPLDFKPLPPPDDLLKEDQPMPGFRRLSIRALMNLIERQARSREAGQLDIYRVFMRVDTVLLRRNGIENLRFTEDRFVSDPELEQALVKSVWKTLGIRCPESVWVDGA